MKIEKINENYYRIRKTIDKKLYTITFDHKPNQKEIMQSFNNAILRPKSTETGTLITYCYKYIDSKSNLLKSSTKRGYNLIINNLPDWLSKKKLKDITESDIERYVNDMAAALSPKSIKNRYSFVVSVLKKYNKSFTCSVTLPVIPVSDSYIPTNDDIKAIIKAIEGTKYEIPIKLACLGLRQSEIGGLTIDDIYDGKAHIHQALTQGENNQWVLEKTNKTSKSTRTVTLPADLYQKILDQGYIYNGSMHTIYDVLKRTCQKLNIPQISIHKLRHFFASYCHDIGISDAVILDLGGWETDHVMKSVYRHAMETEKAAKKATDSIGNLF